MKHRYPILLVGILLLYGLFGLYPTGLARLPAFLWNWAEAGGGEVRFPMPGIIMIPMGSVWVAEAIDTEEFDIDLRVRPALDSAGGPARILTVSADPSERNLTIGQESDALIVRMRHPETSLNGTPNIVISDVFAAGRLADIRLTYGDNQLLVAVDGQELARVVVAENALATWSKTYEVALGNELTMDRPWLGTITQAHISADDVEFDLLAPELHHKPRIIVGRPELGYARGIDIAVNFLGFIPFGVLLVLWVRPSRRRTFAVLALAIVVTSAGIETYQFSLPDRTPSISDFALNVSGGFFGLVLTPMFFRRRPRPLLAVSEGGD